MNSASDSPANSLDEADRLLAQKQYPQACSLAEAALSETSDPARAWAILADAYSHTRSPVDTEAAYRRALEFNFAMPRAVLGLARLLQASSRHDEALDLLQELLVAEPANYDAAALLCDVLAALGRLEEAGPLLDKGFARAPGNQRLVALRGEWLIRVGRPAEGVACLQGLLASNPSRPLVWLALIREADARDDREQSLRLAGDAVAACPDAFWLWQRHLTMLVAAGRQAEAEACIASRTPPAIEAVAAFVQWARLMRNLDESGRVQALLATGDLSEREALAGTVGGALLLADLARDAGNPLQALHWLERVLTIEPGNAALLRQMFHTALLGGEVDIASDVVGRLHRIDPRLRAGIPMSLLHETRIFRGTMNQVREVMRGPASDRLISLSRIIIDEPGCLPAALAWLNQFVVECRKGRCMGIPETPIPKILHHKEEVGEGWLGRHADYRWVDMRSPAAFAAARGLLSSPARDVLMRHPENTRIDLVRIASLHAEGGWWVDASLPCSGTVSQLTLPGARLVVCMNDNGFLMPSWMGCVKGHEAIGAALDIALQVCDEPPRPDSSHATSGVPALTLGVALTLAKDIVEGRVPEHVVVIDIRRRNRLLTMAWPK